MSLHWEFIKRHIAVRMAYRFDFFVSFVAYFFVQLVGPLLVAVIYHAGGQFPGWSFSQMLLLQGTVALVKGFSFMAFFGILWNTNRLVDEGKFDLLLVRPVSTLRLLIMDSFDTEDSAQFIAGLAITIAALALLGGVEGSFILYLLLLLAGVLFFFALAVFSAIVTIRYISTTRLYEFVDIIEILAKYPRTVYGRAASIGLSTVLPLLIAGHYPASALVGFDLAGIGYTLLAVLALVALSLFAWNRTLRWYASAGG